MGIYEFGNNTYPQRIRRRSNLRHIFCKKKMRLVGREIWYILLHCTDYPNCLLILQIHGVFRHTQTTTYMAISCANCYSGAVSQEVQVWYPHRYP